MGLTFSDAQTGTKSTVHALTGGKVCVFGVFLTRKDQADLIKWLLDEWDR